MYIIVDQYRRLHTISIMIKCYSSLLIQLHPIFYGKVNEWIDSTGGRSSRNKIPILYLPSTVLDTCSTDVSLIMFNSSYHLWIFVNYLWPFRWNGMPWIFLWTILLNSSIIRSAKSLENLIEPIKTINFNDW